MSDLAAPCRFGYVEYDGDQYCHEHGGFRHYVEQTMLCDRARADRRDRGEGGR